MRYVITGFYLLRYVLTFLFIFDLQNRTPLHPVGSSRLFPTACPDHYLFPLTDFLQILYIAYMFQSYTEDSIKKELDL